MSPGHAEIASFIERRLDRVERERGKLGAAVCRSDSAVERVLTCDADMYYTDV